MIKSSHKSLKIKEAAQAAVHKKIGSLDRESLVRYFSKRPSRLRYPSTSQNEQTLVRESRPDSKGN